MNIKMIKIGNKAISLRNKTYFIADIAANHDGSLSRAKKLIHLASKAGADAAKFQHFSAKTIVSDKGFKSLGKKSSHQKKWGKSVYDVYKEASINLSWTKELKKTCDEAGIHFFSSPYSFEMVDHLEKFVPAYKIGSGDINWLQIIEHISKKNKPVILASGAANFNDVVKAVNSIKKYNKKVVLMQCNTNYTASVKNFKYINLNVLKEYKKKFKNVILGLSDHTFGHSTVLGAVTLGARVVEKHFTDNNSRVGPDHKFSMNPKTWYEMVNATRELENSLGDGVKRVEKNEEETVVLQRRSIRIITEIKKGEKIKKENIIPLRPCPKNAYPLQKIKNIIGKKANRKFVTGEYIKLSDFK
jgi:sialic acid synthase SpsE